MEDILEDKQQNGGFGGQSGPMENILLNGEHLTPMDGALWQQQKLEDMGNYTLIGPRELSFKKRQTKKDHNSENIDTWRIKI